MGVVAMGLRSFEDSRTFFFGIIVVCSTFHIAGHVEVLKQLL